MFVREEKGLLKASLFVSMGSSQSLTGVGDPTCQENDLDNLRQCKKNMHSQPVIFVICSR